MLIVVSGPSVIHLAGQPTQLGVQGFQAVGGLAIHPI